LTSKITANKERENADLNKFLNDTIQSHNSAMLDQENRHKNNIND